MAKTLQEKVLDYIACTGAALEKAEKQASDKAAQDAQIEKLIPGVVDALARNGRIKPQEKEAAASLLHDPIKALEILGRTAEHRNDEELSRLGSQVSTTKKASHVSGSLNSPYVGARSSGLKDSDRILFERLNLPIPQE